MNDKLFKQFLKELDDAPDYVNYEKIKKRLFLDNLKDLTL